MAREVKKSKKFIEESATELELILGVSNTNWTWTEYIAFLKNWNWTWTEIMVFLWTETEFELKLSVPNWILTVTQIILRAEISLLSLV